MRFPLPLGCALVAVEKSCIDLGLALAEVENAGVYRAVGHQLVYRHGLGLADAVRPIFRLPLKDRRIVLVEEFGAGLKSAFTYRSRG